MSLSLFFDKFINETINIDQAISIFFGHTKPYLISEKEMPNIRFIFPIHFYELFGKVVEKTPIIKDREAYEPTRKDVEAAYQERGIEDSTPTINVEDPIEFFKLIVEITEALQEERKKQMLDGDILSLSEAIQKYIWLRMGEKDFTDVISFLKKQRDFLHDTTLDAYIKEQKVCDYYDYTITAEQTCGHCYDETDKRIVFTLHKDGEKVHHLPIIDFGIREEDGHKVCYVYAVQNVGYLRDKKAERQLYKLNSGIESPNHHPNFVMAMKLFIDMVEKEGIREIRVPDGQALSHAFHEIMSRNAKKKFEEKYGKYDLEDRHCEECVPNILMLNYAINKGYYERLVGKADFIEDAKTTKLVGLLERMSIQFPDYEIASRTEGADYTALRIKTKRYEK